MENEEMAVIPSLSIEEKDNLQRITKKIKEDKGETRDRSQDLGIINDTL